MALVTEDNMRVSVLPELFLYAWRMVPKAPTTINMYPITISGIAGLVMIICSLKGYELLGGHLSKAGVIISCIISVIMVIWIAVIGLLQMETITCDERKAMIGSGKGSQ